MTELLLPTPLTAADFANDIVAGTVPQIVAKADSLVLDCTSDLQVFASVHSVEGSRVVHHRGVFLASNRRHSHLRLLRANVSSAIDGLDHAKSDGAH